MKKITVLFFIMMITAGLVGCAPDILGTVSAPVGEVAPADGQELSPGVYVVPADTIYFNEVPDIISQYGSSVKISFTLTNFDSVARELREFPPEIKIESRNLSFPDSIVRTFSAGQEQVSLQPGESKECVLAWNQRNDFSQQVPYGWYGIRVNLHSHEIEDTRSMQGSGGQVTRVLILPPGGVMEKTIELEQSCTVNDVTVSLEKLEMTAYGTALYSMCIPEGYDFREELNWGTGTDALYKVDDEDWKPAYKAKFGTYLLEDGVRFIWDLDPIPCEADTLSLQITRIGNQEGLWEFNIQLN